MNNLDPLGLKPLRITDRPFIDRLLGSEETMLSAYAFVSHYIWRDIFHYSWDIIDDYFCLFAQYDNYFYMPIPPVPCCMISIENPIPLRNIKEHENVIPAEAGIQNTGRGLDSHFRGNDGQLEEFSGEKGGFRGTLFKVFSLMQATNKNKTISRIENIDATHTEAFISLGYDVTRGEGEYVYRREDLTNLKGDPYKSKRALCNHFIKNYN